MRAQDVEECLLRQIDAPYSLHPLLRLFLILQMFHLALVVAAVQARRYIRAHGGERLSGNNSFAYGGLYGYFEKLPRDYLVCAPLVRKGLVDCTEILTKLFNPGTTDLYLSRAMYYQGKSVYWLAIQ